MERSKSSDPVGRRSLVDFSDQRIIRRDDNLLVNRKKIRRMMKDMGVYIIYPKHNLSKRYHAQYIRPYLLRNLDITHADQVWGVDITYIRMEKDTHININVEFGDENGQISIDTIARKAKNANLTKK